MTSRDRVLVALAHEEPDRPPFNLRPCGAIIDRLRRERGNPDVDLAEFFGHDVRYVSIPLAQRPEGVAARDWTPTPTDAQVAACAVDVRRLRDLGVAVCGSYACGVFEQVKHWFGDAEALTSPYDDPSGLTAALDRITEWKSAVYGAYARAGVDIVWIGDDMGMQNGLVMSWSQYRDWYLPRHTRIVEYLRSIRPDVYIAFHCCGHVTPLIPDLIEIGIDILEAVQPECMDIAQLKSDFGRDLAFWGAIGEQSVMARSGPQAIVRAVHQTLDIMAPGGGYIAAPCHTLTEETPWENVVAFHEAVRSYRRHSGFPR